MRNQLLLFGFLFVCHLGWSQSTVSGTVTDTDGEPLIAASVLEQGTSNGTLSNVDGNFVLTMENDANPLVISYVGYSTQTIIIDGQSSISVILDADGQVLEQVVVNALGLEVPKDSQGSTYSVIQADDVQRSGEANLINGLGAKASNVRINRSNGDPGAGSSIRIRGANTISGNNEPLIVVDGVPMDNSTTYAGGSSRAGGQNGGTSQQSRLNDLNPNDIESIQVLKGASAGAVWGTRAANGVIVITTKRGKPGKAKISFGSSYSIDEISERVPMQTTWGQGRNGSYSPTASESWGDYIPDRSGSTDVFNTGGAFFTDQNGTVHYPLASGGKNSSQTYVDSNWDQVINNGQFFQNNISIGGGHEKGTYFFSVARLDQGGIIENSDYDRTNLRLNNKLFLNDLLTLSTKTSYTLTNSNRTQQSNNTTGLMLGLLRTPADFDITGYRGTYTSSSGQEFTNRHRSYRRYLGNNVNPTYNNPNWTVQEQKAGNDVNRFTITPQLDITPNSWLLMVLRGSADIADDKRGFFWPISSAGTRSAGIFQEDVIGRREISFDAIAKGTFNLTDEIDMNATVGWSINDRKYRRNSGIIEGFLVNARKETTSLNTSAESSTFQNVNTLFRSNRGYGILSFDLFDQVNVNLTGAVEAASSVKDNLFYPAADVAWDMTNSLGGADWLSFAKLRASWGKVGVLPVPHRFQTLAETGFTYSSYSDPLDVSFFGGGFRLDDDLGNPNLKPEVKTEWEIGADLRLLDERLGYTVTYYNNKIKDILLNVDLSPSSGFDTQYGNFGNMTNSGLEMDFDYDAIQKENFNLNVFANWATNKNEVTNLVGVESIDLTGLSISSRAIVGHPLGVLYGTGSKTLADGSLDLDGNGFPQLSSSPVVLGDPNPDWRGGLGFGAKYKKLSLDVLLEHSQGGDFAPRSLWVLRRFGTTQETANRITLDQNYTNFDGNTVAAGTTLRGSLHDFGGGTVLLDETWYRHGIGGGFGDNQVYNFAIYDATFTKLREVGLNYRFDSDGLRNNTPLEGITIGATARNWFNWNKIPGVDPETNVNGVSNGFGTEYFTNPQTRSFVFSLNAEF